jgi:hypothetical protein
MKNIPHNTIEAILSDLAGVNVVLHEAVPSHWVAVPLEKIHIRSKVWRKLRSGPASGIGASPIEAALLMARAIGEGGPRKVAPKYRARAWLINLLSDGQPIQVGEIRSMADSAGMTWSSVDRAARELCISRKKCGFRKGWTWKRFDTFEDS